MTSWRRALPSDSRGTAAAPSRGPWRAGPPATPREAWGRRPRTVFRRWASVGIPADAVLTPKRTGLCGPVLEKSRPAHRGFCPHSLNLAPRAFPLLWHVPGGRRAGPRDLTVKRQVHRSAWSQGPQSTSGGDRAQDPRLGAVRRSNTRELPGVVPETSASIREALRAGAFMGRSGSGGRRPVRLVVEGPRAGDAALGILSANRRWHEVGVACHTAPGWLPRHRALRPDASKDPGSARLSRGAPGKPWGSGRHLPQRPIQRG